MYPEWSFYKEIAYLVFRDFVCALISFILLLVCVFIYLNFLRQRQIDWTKKYLHSNEQ